MTVRIEAEHDDVLPEMPRWNAAPVRLSDRMKEVMMSEGRFIGKGRKKVTGDSLGDAQVKCGYLPYYAPGRYC